MWLKPTWRSPLVFVDGSGRHPKDLAVRVVGFGIICGQVAGKWCTEAGWLRPGESVTAAECTAAARAFSLCIQGGTVVTDCKAVYHMFRWLRKLKGRAAAQAGTLKHTCWELLADAIRDRPDVELQWMRSHRSRAEALRLGISENWRIGNDKADELAKQAAGWVDLPEHLMQQHLRHSCCAERFADTVATIQLRRLQARTRTEDGGAAKNGGECNRVSRGGSGKGARREPGPPRRKGKPQRRRQDPLLQATCYR